MDKINNIIRELELLRGKRVFIGVSGGADSIALLLLALAAELEVEVISFEHGIRGEESRADAEFTSKFCAERKVPCRVIALDVPANAAPAENLEAAARRLRLAAWEKITAEHPDSPILLGHHADDAAENLLLRLGRGSNLSGLTNLRREKRLGTLRIVRPLLPLNRAEIEDFLRTQDVSFRIDATNADPAYQRNHIRHNILTPWKQAFPQVSGGITAALAALTADAEFIELEAEKRFALIAGSSSTPLKFWQDQPDALLYRLLTRYFDLPALTAATMARVKGFLFGDGGSCQVGKYLWRRERTELIFTPLPTTAPATLAWRWRQESTVRWGNFLLTAELGTGLPAELAPDPSRAYFNALLLADTLAITPREPGDTLRLFSGRQKSVKELFIAAKLSADEKAARPIIRANGVIIWIPGIANSDFAPAAPTGATVTLRIVSES